MNSTFNIQVFSVEANIWVSLGFFEGGFVLWVVSWSFFEAEADLGQINLFSNWLGGIYGNTMLLNEA